MSGAVLGLSDARLEHLAKRGSVETRLAAAEALRLRRAMRELNRRLMQEGVKFIIDAVNNHAPGENADPFAVDYPRVSR